MPGDPRLRASDSDRDRTATLLREHHAAGRLTPEEFDQRLNRVFTATTIGELDAILADMPGIDLYQLPAAGIVPAGYRIGGSGKLSRRPDGQLTPFRPAAWGFWAAGSALLFIIWFGVGVAVGGVAWLPWFLLVAIPWALAISRRLPGRY
jgi:hypothetical protein